MIEHRAAFVLFCVVAGVVAGLAIAVGALAWWLWKWTMIK